MFKKEDILRFVKVLGIVLCTIFSLVILSFLTYKLNESTKKEKSQQNEKIIENDTIISNGEYKDCKNDILN
jgi:preprotein translocase subunit YajC